MRASAPPRPSPWLAALVAAGVASAALAPPAAHAKPRAERKDGKRPTADDGDAVGKPAAPTKAQQKQARIRSADGSAAMEAGDFDAAVAAFTEAYELDPTPQLLVELAEAHRKAGRPAEALAFYEQFLATNPKGKKAAAAKRRVKELQKAVAAAEEEARRRAEEEEQARRLAEQQAAEEAERQRVAEEEARAAEAAAAAERTRRRRGTTSLIVGASLGGAGLVGIGVGVVFGLKASSLSDELSQPMAVYDPAKQADGESAERAMLLGVTLGSACLVAGAVFTWRWWSGRRREAPVALAPVLAGNTTGVVLVGGF